jgi:uncharacterized membrane protein
MAQRLSRAQQPAGISEVSMAHLHRAEVQRSTEWRTRLDNTTNWAITTAAAVVSFSFSSADSPHPVLLAGAGMVFTFLVVEARRYRYYDLWAQRVRLFESGFWGPLIRREPVTADFYAALAGEMVAPRLRIGMLESLAFRMKRTYWPIIGLLLAAWVVKLDIHPTPSPTPGELIRRARLGPLPGTAMIALWVLAVAAYVWILVAAYRFPLPPTELRAPGKRRRQPLAAAFRTVGTEGRVRVRRRPTLRPITPEERAGA